MVKRKRKKKKSAKAISIKYALYATGVLGLLLAIFIGAISIGWFGALPGESKLESIKNETATLVFSNEDKLLGKIFAENRTDVTYQQLPEHLIQALIATEDARYFDHSGIDGKSYLRVFFKTLLLGNKSSGGGSTITQQLAKNLFGRPSFGMLTMPVNKIKEAIVAFRLEKIYTKEEILLLYFNTVPFGENVFGIEAAANRYFNCNTSDLSLPQSAVLVGVLKANTYYNPRLHPQNALNRRNLVMSLMVKNGYLSSARYDQLKTAPLGLDYENYSIKGRANYFMTQVKREARNIIEEINRSQSLSLDMEKDGLKIYTTLDLELQSAFLKSIQSQLQKMQPYLDKELAASKDKFVKPIVGDMKRNREILTGEGTSIKEISRQDSLWHYKKMLHAAVLSADPVSGAIRVWIGGNNHRYLPYDLVKTKRTAASSFKPVLYAAALEKGLILCDYLANKEKEYPEYDHWHPKNYDGTSGGFTAMWYALIKSMNLPTIDLYFQTGHEQYDYVARKLKFENAIPDSPVAALGVNAVSVQELVRAYAAFANFGLMPELYMIDRIEDHDGKVIYQHQHQMPEQVLDEHVAEQMVAVLNKAAHHGTGAAMYSRYGLSWQWASKTGTSQDYSDARFMVFNRKLVTGVWVGANDPKIHFRHGYFGSGSALALPIAANAFKQMEKSTSLKEKYYTDMRPAVDDGLMDCPGKVKNKVIKSLMDVVAPGLIKERATDSISSRNTEEKNETKVGRFFRKLFGKKKK